MNRHILFFVFASTLLACTKSGKKEAETIRPFHVPVLVQNPSSDTIASTNVEFLSEAYFKFFGKYTFRDTLFLYNTFRWDSTYEKDIIREYSRYQDNDTLATDGFQIFTDYNTSVYYKQKAFLKPCYYFPVYVVNETSSSKAFYAKDSYVFGLQEAVDTSDYNRWRPVEGKGYDFCGNGEYGLIVLPGEFIVFLVPKYQGNEKGLMRVRLKIGESIYVSKPYQGLFNKEQFSIKEGSIYDRISKSDQGWAIQGLFYGAVPKGYERKR